MLVATPLAGSTQPRNCWRWQLTTSTRTGFENIDLPVHGSFSRGNSVHSPEPLRLSVKFFRDNDRRWGSPKGFKVVV